MELWKHAFRVGFAPHLSTESLEALATALRDDDSRLMTGGTTSPPPLACVQDWNVERACPIAYCGVVDFGGFGEAIIADVEEFFAKACFEAERSMGEPNGARHLLCWVDETPRDEMRSALLAEVNTVLAERADAAPVVVRIAE